VNKKQAKANRKGYREAGQLYWTDEMSAILKKKNRELIAYRWGVLGCLAFALAVALIHVL
jgi:hypothetical protein